LDDCFNGFLQKYGADKCKSILGGEGHVRREAQIRVSPKISADLRGLKLSGTVEERVRDDHLEAPPLKRIDRNLGVNLAK